MDTFPRYKDTEAARLKEELAGAAPTIRALVLYLSGCMLYTYNAVPVLTMVGRTGQEQKDIYKADPTFRIKPRRSYHQLEPSQAVDLRYSTLTFEQWTDMLALIDDAFKSLPKRVIIHTPEQYEADKKNGKYAYVPHIHIETHSKDFNEKELACMSPSASCLQCPLFLESEQVLSTLDM